MDNITPTLVSQLLDKALENTKAEERLAFVEKLFSQLPPEGQQEFLLSLTRMVLEGSTPPVIVQKVFNPDFIEPRLVNIYQSTSDDFAPGQICCQALSGFASLPGMDEDQVVVIANMFNGLADETRVKIVKLLAKGEFTVDDLMEFLDVPQRMGG